METEISRGDIYYAELDGIGSEQVGRRPVVIVQNDIGNQLANTVIVVPLTKKIDLKVKLPTHILVRAFGNIKYDSTILTEQIRTIDKMRLLRKIGRLPYGLVKKMDKSLLIAIGIENNDMSK